MRHGLVAVLALLSLPVSGYAQPGGSYVDGFGTPLLFAQVEIPVYDQTGHPLVNPNTQEPIGATFCITVPVDERRTDVTKQVSSSDANWLQGIHYSLDLPQRQIVIHRVWMLDTIRTAQSPGYQVVKSPRVISYNLDDYRAPLSSTRPLDNRCNWDQILANLTVQRQVPSGGGGAGTSGPSMLASPNCTVQSNSSLPECSSMYNGYRQRR